MKTGSRKHNSSCVGNIGRAESFRLARLLAGVRLLAAAGRVGGVPAGTPCFHYGAEAEPHHWEGAVGLRAERGVYGGSVLKTLRQVSIIL